MLQSGDSTVEFWELQQAPEPKDIQKLIYEHLVHHCYSDTAIEFGGNCKPENAANNTSDGLEGEAGSGAGQGEARGEPGALGGSENSLTGASPTKYYNDNDDDDSMDLDGETKPHPYSLGLLQQRRQVRSMILDGFISEALGFLALNFPNLLTLDNPESAKVAFSIKCQEFIEKVRIGSPDVLDFAQNELGSFASLNESCTNTLQDVISLIAYPDPSSSPLANYLSQNRRNEVATDLNNYIISWHGGNSCTGLERLAQQSTVVRDLLFTEASKDVKSQKIVYPKWSVSNFLL